MRTVCWYQRVCPSTLFKSRRPNETNEPVETWHYNSRKKIYYCNRSDVPFRNESTEVAWLQKHQIVESLKRSSQSLLTFQTWDFVFWFYWVFNKNIQNLLKWKKLGLCKNFQKNIKRWQYVLHIIFTADVCVCLLCVCVCMYVFILFHLGGFFRLQ